MNVQLIFPLFRGYYYARYHSCGDLILSNQVINGKR